ncbi:putative mitochondrial hypothetical protein [Leptomonas pyrrhocoris]|uniref:Uncharacterized protein n=1 Tax=Leptomonas pyrrhocoris TaxID=157538 RepID=A0A0M9G6Z9_LEPPY|nr:putative mitochondrial hypothetical protein [Leptomonas pyrrhocoris]XP_015662205.1 putative mitochondrial hypothetical protein [Leptomonas pyrrhocoris]XP_015662206.1 putative mitochondrial hypothetical protein [Leptomonas pyrrhocoris]KPA83765.1 putative mitochondrial hypothetical protein [Leptomonas pyrrhocoris]KPA83766.1 putative mitochondrial hypothetical protein [Leptomonas pyrrhocoris]KPA83767.1 putative mitochondrial hypothetical protein [Leptomonas pyrrhocoris]|eukprot:XP_015662204.1 putative mitochondrial hypothetical protein [Leptomonas pyrrhocoris]
MAAVSSAEIAKRIREGNLKRKEEERKKQQLEQEYRDVISEKMNEEHQKRSPTRFLPSIFIFLLFVSFPLSDQVVDWYLVGIFCVLNTLLALAFTNPTDWMSVASTVLINFFLVRFSADVYQLPERLMQVPMVLLLNYVAVNVLIVAAAYCIYVNPRFLDYKHRYQRPRRPAGTSKKKALTADDQTVLDEFAMEKAKAERLDLLLCLLLLLNLAAMIYLNVIPFEAVWKGGLNAFRMLQ